MTAEATVVAPEPAIIAPEEESAATVVSSRLSPLARARKRRRRCQRGAGGTRGRREPEKDDVLAERAEDEADHQLRLREREDVFRRDPSLPLDDDIAAEVEADRFVAEDFLIGAAGAASAAPKSPYDDHVRDLPLDDDPADTLVAARTEDHEVRVDDGGLSGAPGKTTSSRPETAGNTGRSLKGRARR